MDAPLKVRWQLDKLYAKQQAAFFSTARLIYTDGSTKSGKTVGALTWQLCQCWKEGAGQAHLWVAPVYPQAKVAFERACRFLRRDDPTGRVWKANKTDLCIEFVNGSRWFFKGSDNADSIYGSDYASVVMDEVTRCKEDARAAVRSTTTKTKGPVRMIGNVKGRKNWAYRLAELIKQGSIPKAEYHKITAMDAVEAGVLDQEDLDSAKAELPEHVFRELYLCEPTEDGANPFSLAAIAKCMGPIGSGPAIAYGIDLAKSVDYTVVVGINGAGKVCSCERWHGLDWNLTAQKIVAMVGETPCLCDASGIGDPIIDGLRRQIPLIEGYKTGVPAQKQMIMEGLAVAIQQGSIGLPDTPDSQLRHELESFEYSLTRTGKVSYSAPEGLHDDCVVALALAWHLYDKVQHGGTSLDVVHLDVIGDRDADDAMWETVSTGW